MAALPTLAAADEVAWQALREGGIVLFRHAIALGAGDPPGMRLGDCATQCNLNAAGREQARRMGEAVRAAGVIVGAVLASEWCRTMETAEFAFPGHVVAEPAFHSFFADRSTASMQTAAARALMLAWDGPGTLAVSTHQVNITALTGMVPTSGEGVVLRRRGDALVVVGRIQPQPRAAGRIAGSDPPGPTHCGGTPPRHQASRDAEQCSPPRFQPLACRAHGFHDEVAHCPHLCRSSKVRMQDEPDILERTSSGCSSRESPASASP